MKQTNPPSRRANIKEIEKLFELGAHLGHKKSRLHPRARKNVYTILNGTSVIDLTKTVDQLDIAKKYLSDVAKNGKTVLVVGTKKVVSAYLKKYCVENKVPYITSKWLPGLLTNFESLMNNVKKLKNLKNDRDTGAWDALVKHERTKLSKEISKLEKLYAGLESTTVRPDMMIIVDPKKEKNALKEAKAYKIPVVALVDTNADPTEIDYPVVANDDTSQVVEYIMHQLLEAYAKTPKKEIKVEPKVEPKVN